MSYLLYLKRSLLRRTKQHLSLLIILTCAFILPLLISVYRDSSVYGRKQQLLDLTSGVTFRISNAVESDITYFENMSGLSAPEYFDGEIRLTILNDRAWQNEREYANYGMKIMRVIEDNGLSHLYASSYGYDMAHGIPDSSEASEHTALLLLNFGIIVISSFIVGSAYKSHIRRFSSDMGILRSCGAENRQIFTIFLVEFIVTFSVSALLAVVISAAVMKLLFMSYLQVNDIEGLAWIIFRMEPLNTLLHIAVFFVVLLVIITRTLVKFDKESTVGAVRSDIQTIELKKTSKKLKEKAAPVKTLSSLWLQRTNKTHRSCLWVTVPIMTVFLFLFAYLSLDADYISASREYELRLYKTPHFGSFTQEDIDYINGLPYIEDVKCTRDVPEEAFDQEADGLMINRIEIKLTSPELHSEVEELLNQRFDGAQYDIHNYQAVADRGMELSKGIYLMLLFIFAAMFLFILIIVSMKLFDYINDSKKTVKTLSTLGASKKVIEASYIRQSMIAAVLASVLPGVISVILYIPATASATQKTTIDLGLISGYMTVSLLTAAAFILPVRRSLKGILGGKRS